MRVLVGRGETGGVVSGFGIQVGTR
jgi:hypothetical protein